MLRDICQNRQTCRIDVNKRFFGEEECPGLSDKEMSLWLTYSCDGGSDRSRIVRQKCGTAPDGGTVSSSSDTGSAAAVSSPRNESPEISTSPSVSWHSDPTSISSTKAPEIDPVSWEPSSTPDLDPLSNTTSESPTENGSPENECGGGKREQLDVKGCGGWINLECVGGCLNIREVGPKLSFSRENQII